MKGLSGILFVFLTLFVVLAVSAQEEANPSSLDQRIPERSGIYNDPGKPGVKVRVFVHPAKPTTGSSSALACDLTDPQSTAVVGATGWKLPSIWKFNLNPSSVPSSVGGGNLITISNLGFNQWEVASNGSVDFQQDANTTITRSAYDGKNVIAWGRTNGSALGVTYTRYYSSTGEVVDVDTIMNKKFAWKWSGSNVSCADTNAYDAQDILTHEQGHWMGLDDEYTAPYVDNTMYGYGSKGETKKDSLTEGDTIGTLNIYNP